MKLMMPGRISEAIPSMTAEAETRAMLCYCLNLTYEDVRGLWRTGYFRRTSEHHPGQYCTGCRGDLGWFLERLARDGEADGSQSPAVSLQKTEH
jgi:hypothetical protein